MPSTDHDDPAMDRLLSRALAGAEAPGSACVDAETLGAWVERTLTVAEQRRVEAHVSSCSRCQALAAAFVRTELVEPRVVVSFWERWHLQWLGPIAAAAAVVLIYVAMRPTAPTLESTESRAEPTAIQAPIPAEPPTSAPAVAETELRRQPQQDQAAPKVSPEATRERATDSSAVGSAESDRSFAPLAAPPSPPPSASQSAAAASRQAPAPALPPVPLADGAERTEQGLGDRGRGVGGREPDAGGAGQATNAAPAPQVAAAPPLLRGAESRAALGVSTPTGLEVRTADGRARWRRAMNDRMEYSADAGATWRPTSLATASSIRAGFSPGGLVCWLVGEGGAVWVTTDGLMFSRIPFPEATALSGVVATSARAAAVTTVTGRTFRTSDGGATWNQDPNP